MIRIRLASGCWLLLFLLCVYVPLLALFVCKVVPATAPKKQKTKEKSNKRWTYVVFHPFQLSRVELLVLVESLDVIVDLLDRLIDLLTVGGIVGHLSLQGGHVGACQLELAGRFLLLLQLAGHVDRTVQIDDLAFHFGQRRL